MLHSLLGWDFLSKLNTTVTFAPGQMDLKVPAEQAWALQQLDVTPTSKTTGCIHSGRDTAGGEHGDTGRWEEQHKQLCPHRLGPGLRWFVPRLRATDQTEEEIFIQSLIHTLCSLLCLKIFVGSPYWIWRICVCVCVCVCARARACVLYPWALNPKSCLLLKVKI